MTNDKLLQKIRKDRPTQVIHEVISFSKNEYGFYDVEVNMEAYFFGTTIEHYATILPYPLKSYNKLSEHERTKYRLEHTF